MYQNILSSTAYQSFPKWLPTYLTPSRNKLLWNFHDYANRHLHEDWGENSFSQLGDERKIPESKQGLGLCSSALAFILEFYNDLWVCGMIFHHRFHGVVRLGKHENFIKILMLMQKYLAPLFSGLWGFLWSSESRTKLIAVMLTDEICRRPSRSKHFYRILRFVFKNY